MLLFCQLPPISINPPDFCPIALIVELSLILIFSAVTLIEPPLFSLELDAIVPAFDIFPFLAVRKILPPCLVMPSALNEPELFITAFFTSLTPFADKIIVPLSTFIACLLSINEFKTPRLIEYCIKLFPLRLKLTVSPEIKAAVPLEVSIFPLLCIWGAIKAIVPPSKALISPWLFTTPENPLFWKIYLSFIKSPSFKFSEDAIIEPTSTFEPFWKITPLGLIRTICPFDFKLPYMWVGSFDWTLFRAVEIVLGCLNSTLLAFPILNDDQFVISFWVLCFIVRLFPTFSKEALPWVTEGFSGSSWELPSKTKHENTIEFIVSILHNLFLKLNIVKI